LCTPVDKNGEGIIDPTAHLCCYKLKAKALKPPPDVEVVSQFQKMIMWVRACGDRVRYQARCCRWIVIIRISGKESILKYPLMEIE
jgi:hypothetical protein